MSIDGIFKNTYKWKLTFPMIFLAITVFAMLASADQKTAIKGEITFIEHCAECHGDKGDGQGSVGPYLEGQRPTNLLDEKTRVRSDQDLFKIIRYGIHIEMPSWEDVLTDQEISNVINFLRILVPPFHLVPD